MRQLWPIRHRGKLNRAVVGRLSSNVPGMLERFLGPVQDGHCRHESLSDVRVSASGNQQQSDEKAFQKQPLTDLLCRHCESKAPGYNTFMGTMKTCSYIELAMLGHLECHRARLYSCQTRERFFLARVMNLTSFVTFDNEMQMC